MNKEKLLKALSIDVTVNHGEPEDFAILAEALEKGYIEETQKYVYELTDLGQSIFKQ